MTRSRKNILLLVFSIAMVSLVLLSSGLSNLELRPGMPLPVVETHHAARGSVTPLGRVYSFDFLQAVLGLLLFLLMVYVPARLILFFKLRWLFRLVQILAILLVVVLFFYFIRFDPGCYTDACSQTMPAPIPGAPVMSAEAPPENMIGYLEIGLILAAILFSFWVFVRLFRPAAVDPVLLHAELAVRDMNAGKDFKSVIVQCYLQMAATLQKEHGIERHSSMTSREFEEMLASRGFPPAPVHELTHLFEKVRYSQDVLSRDDEQAAMNCLTAIIGFSGTRSDG